VATPAKGDDLFYIGLAFIYVALLIVVFADVLRNRNLSTGGKVAWIAAFIVFSVAAWCVYGFIRLRESRGL
jgi:hypothetical protein